MTTPVKLAILPAAHAVPPDLCGQDRTAPAFAPRALGRMGREWGVCLRPDRVGLSVEAGKARNMNCAVIGAPGLWKRVESAAGPYLVWEMPRWLIPDREQVECEEWSDFLDVDAWFDWAEACLHGCVDPDWRTPSNDWIESALPPHSRTIQTNGLIRRSAVVCGPTRFALRCPVVHRVDDRLDAMRTEALEMLAADAMRVWAMVRFGFECGTGKCGDSLVAEVDLTGAPESEGLYRAAGEALAHAVAAVVETAELLADPQINLQSLGDCWFEPQKNKETKGDQK